MPHGEREIFVMAIEPIRFDAELHRGFRDIQESVSSL